MFSFNSSINLYRLSDHYANTITNKARDLVNSNPNYHIWKAFNYNFWLLHDPRSPETTDNIMTLWMYPTKTSIEIYSYIHYIYITTISMLKKAETKSGFIFLLNGNEYTPNKFTARFAFFGGFYGWPHQNHIFLLLFFHHRTHSNNPFTRMCQSTNPPDPLTIQFY